MREYYVFGKEQLKNVYAWKACGGLVQTIYLTNELKEVQRWGELHRVAHN